MSEKLDPANRAATVGSPSAFRKIYTSGGPVQAGSGRYIERPADDEIFELCRNGEYAFILSTRQVGKSSLMFRAGERLEEEGILSVVVDLQQLGTKTTAEQWYLGLVDQIAAPLLPEFDVVQWWQDRAPFSHADRLTRFFQDVLLTEIKQRIVIFIDEIDTTLSLDFTDDFFGVIRLLCTDRPKVPEFQRLSFVLIGVANPNDLISDPKRTPFNIGQPVELTAFTFDEALPLAEGFGLPEAQAGQVLRWVLKWTGGHPFLTQRLCLQIAEKGHDHWTEAEIDQLVEDTFLGPHSWKDSNLSAVRDLLTRRAPKGYENDVLITYRRIRLGQQMVRDEERSPVKSHLKLAGVVRPDGQGALRTHNPIYQRVFDEQWIKENLRGTWLKRLVYTNLATLLLLLLLIPISIYAWNRKTVAEQAVQAEHEARQAAEEQRQIADDQRRIADHQRQNADAKTQEASDLLELARAGVRDSLRQKQRAEMEATLARIARGQAEEQRHRAEAALADAETARDAAKAAANAKRSQRDIAQSRELAVYAKSQMPIDPQLSVYLALKATEVSPTEQAVEALRESVTQSFSQAILQRHTGVVSSASFSPDGKSVVTASGDGTAQVWEANSEGRLIATLRGQGGYVLSASFSPDSKQIVTAGADGTARVWEAGDGRLIATLQGHTAAVENASFSPDGKWIVTASDDHTARVWEAGSGHLITTLLGHTGALYSASFSPDGKWIVTAGADKTALVYPWEMFAPVEDILALARKRSFRGLTLEEQARYLHKTQSNPVESEPKR